MDAIGLIGGTFDPIHFAHLRMALECQQALQLKQVRFIPCKLPLLKPGKVTDSAHRVEMLKLAIEGEKDWFIDDRELTRDTPSYMVDTLISLRTEYQKEALCLILGSDAFAELPNWHRWQEILSFCHLIIIERSLEEQVYPDDVKNLLERFQSKTVEPLRTQTSGAIYIQPVTHLNISSTQIRSLIGKELNPRYLLPIQALKYIYENQLYS